MLRERLERALRLAIARHDHIATILLQKRLGGL